MSGAVAATVAWVGINAAAIGAAAAVVGGAAAVYGTVQAGQAQKKSQSTQQQAIQQQQAAQQTQQRATELKQAQQRQQIVRSARLQRASVVQAGVASGAGGSSSNIQGAVSSIGSQRAENLSFLDNQFGLTNTANSELGAAGIFQSQSNLFAGDAAFDSSVARTGASIFSAAGGFDAFASKGTSPDYVGPRPQGT